MGKLTRPRFLIMYGLLPLVFWVANSSETQFRIGIPLVVLGLLLRLWANGFIGNRKVNWTQKWRGDAKVGQLITAGPYAYVRHPLYLGTLVIVLGVGVIVGHWLLLALAFFALIRIYQSKIKEEEATLADECGPTYQDYCKAVRRLVPRLTAYSPRAGRFSWQGLAASREWKTVIWVTVLLIVLYVREEYWQEQEWVHSTDWLKHALYGVAALSLMIIDGLLELSYRREKKLANAR